MDDWRTGWRQCDYNMPLKQGIKTYSLSSLVILVSWYMYLFTARLWQLRQTLTQRVLSDINNFREMSERRYSYKPCEDPAPSLSQSALSPAMYHKYPQLNCVSYWPLLGHKWCIQRPCNWWACFSCACMQAWPFFLQYILTYYRADPF